MPSTVGKRDPSHCTALGKVLLAYKNEEELLPIIYGNALEKLTPNTISNPDQLRTELGKVRHEGYALDNEEYEIGLMCVAAPVLDQNLNVLGAVGVAGPVSRIKIHLDEQIEAVLRTSQVFSNRLGSGIKYLSDRVRRSHSNLKS
jgi:IclR family KDG regulon transcriptional repressor